jgi:hypothetical protein
MLGLFPSRLLDIVQEHCEFQNLIIDTLDGGSDGKCVLHDALDVVKAVCHGLAGVTYTPDDFTSYGICQLRHTDSIFS